MMIQPAASPNRPISRPTAGTSPHMQHSRFFWLELTQYAKWDTVTLMWGPELRGAKRKTGPQRSLPACAAPTARARPSAATLALAPWRVRCASARV